MDLQLESEIRLHICEIPYSVKVEDVSPETTLNTYLRDKLHLTATKKMCLEGGCGVCIVAVETSDANGKNKKTFAVNSCLVSIFSCHGWKILTNEGIGNSLKGYNFVQKLLAENNGSQCGFCSSGMVMNMYALHVAGTQTKQTIENSFGSNLCRCTGYRPILTAFKKLATDSDDIKELDDLEDIKLCSAKRCNQQQLCQQKSICFRPLLAPKWMKVYRLADLLQILATSGTKRYVLVAGNTGKGVYKKSGKLPTGYIDVAAVAELTAYQILEHGLSLGGGMTLTDTMEVFRTMSKQREEFSYMSKLADHIDLVAHIPVRNIGTLAGNLMLKHQHNEFQSDIFLILETVNATIVIVDSEKNEQRLSPQAFLEISMSKKVITEIILPAYGPDYRYASYKIMPRAQSVHALVNAGFLLEIDGAEGSVRSSRIVFGAINPTFVHASKTEKLLKGKRLFDNDVLQHAFRSLDGELMPDWKLPDPKPEFRKQLAINLFYKFILSIAPASKVSDRNKSGATLLTRPVSNGTQQIYSDKDLYPLTQPISKLEALAQTSGQAEYIIDKPDHPGQLHAVFVKAETVPGSILISVDTSKAKTVPGVIAFFSAKDIPGLNTIGVSKLGQSVTEEVFCSGTVQHFHQPIGLIVATSHVSAREAAALVSIKTKAPEKKPLLSIQEVLKQNASKRITHQTSFVAKKKGKDVKAVIKGEINLTEQYHFHMENQNCLVIPTEDGLEVYASTQWMDHIQGVISQVVKIPSQKINLHVRRLGGGFGAKLTRNGFVAAATALAADKLKKPVRMWLELEDNMDIIGKRYPFYCTYEVGVNEVGYIQYLKADLYTDYGIGSNESVDSLLVAQFQNCYLTDTWTFDTYTVNTDKYAHCFTRAPGTLEGLAAIENIMEHIAYELKVDPSAVRQVNLDNKSNQLLVNILDDIQKSAEIQNRKTAIDDYNKANRWKKKGFSIVPMKWILEVAANYTTLVSIYHLDGGVVVSHGGIEMGQGINTKVAQVCAYKFGISIEKVSVKQAYNVVSPNSASSGGSLTSEAVVYSLLKACDVLLARIKPIREKNLNASWEQLIQLCYNANICLSANGFYSQDEPNIAEYPIYAACALEVEVDILTGKHEIVRVDILEDVGQSMSPLIDIGQLEGGFIMGLGYYSSEELIYDSYGRLLTDRTWHYYPYGPKDIPQDFRVGFVNNSVNPIGVLKSKAIAEPPTCLSITFPLAIRNALASARKDVSDSTSVWYPIDGPSTVEHTLSNTLSDYKEFKL